MLTPDQFAARLSRLSSEKRALLEKRQRLSLTNGKIEPQQTIPRRLSSDPAPLSCSQDRLWLLDQLIPGNSIFTLARVLHVHRVVNASALGRAVEIIASRHEVLRTTFSVNDGVPVQVVSVSSQIPVNFVDLRGLPAVERESNGYDLASLEVMRPFALAAGPLVRVSLFQLDETDYMVLLAMHHIISDVWSLRLFVRELEAVYDSLCTGHPPQLPDLPIQYGDYTVWQRQRLRANFLEGHLRYWSKALEGASELALPSDHPRPAEQSYRGAHIPFALEAHLSARLAAIGQRGGATLFMVLLAGFYALLARYTGQQDIVIGSAVAGRNSEELECLIGFFVNSLVLRCNLSGNPTFSELVARVRDMALDAYAHQDLPFEVLVEKLQPRRNISRHPFFQVTFQLITLPGTGGGSAFQPTEVTRPTSGFDLVFDLWGTAAGVGGRVDYSTDLFERSTVDRLCAHYRNLLTGAAADPNLRVSELPLLSGAERTRAAVEWNATATAHSLEICLHEVVEAQVERTPDAIAVIAGETVLTFAGLNRRADVLAGHLRSLGVRPDTPVGVFVPRSADLVVAMLAVLKAGGAYVPLDAVYPPDRLRYILEVSGATVLLTSDSTPSKLGQHAAAEINIERIHLDGCAPRLGHVENATSSNLAYILYTSGSTGRPKGVMVEHRSVVNHMLWMQARFPIGAGDRVLQRTPVSFDASVWEFYAPLVAGATLVMAPVQLHFNHAELARTIREQHITILQLVPSLLRLLLEEDQFRDCIRLKRVFCGGEPLTGELRNRFFSVLPTAELCNLYGPTEACIDATYHVARPSDVGRNVPIGRPISNMRAYIVDEHANIVPVGVQGELLLAGPGLSRGYLNQSELTAARFVCNPFDRDPYSRMYRTGDRCKYLPGGEIEYLGRVDTQVKVRGFRVELEEIEQVLLEYPAVKACVATLQRYAGNESRVVAYVVPASLSVDEESFANGVRQFLKTRLPGPFVPATVLFLQALPLMANGKIDRASLPSLDSSLRDRPQSLVAPRTDVERQLAEICRAVLNLDDMGVHDNLFELGAHSLLATQIISRVRALLSAELELRHFFDQPTVAELASLVERSRLSPEIPVVSIERLDRDKYRRALTAAGDAHAGNSEESC
jgi:amino acid adenylation domain-containing protein